MSSSRLGQVADRAGRVAIGADAELVRPLEFQDVGDLLEGKGDFDVGHHGAFRKSCLPVWQKKPVLLQKVPGGLSIGSGQDGGFRFGGFFRDGGIFRFQVVRNGFRIFGEPEASIP